MLILRNVYLVGCPVDDGLAARIIPLNCAVPIGDPLRHPSQLDPLIQFSITDLAVTFSPTVELVRRILPIPR